MGSSVPFENSLNSGWYIENGEDWDNVTNNSGWYCRWDWLVDGSTSHTWALCCDK